MVVKHEVGCRPSVLCATSFGPPSQLSPGCPLRRAFASQEEPLVNGKAAGLEGGAKASAGAAARAGRGGKPSQHQAASSPPSLTYQAKNALVWGLSKIIRLVDGSARQRYGWCVTGLRNVPLGQPPTTAKGAGWCLLLRVSHEPLPMHRGTHVLTPIAGTRT